MKKIFLLAMAAGCAMALQAQEIELPTMGWSSWNTFALNISDSIIMNQADVMASTPLKDAGYKYINIDDGYFGGRDPKTGQLLIHPQRFPRGLKGVVDHIHALGLKAGIYSDAGANTCGNYYGGDAIAHEVGLYRHDQQDCDFFFKELDFDFIKVDYCGADAPQNRQRYCLDPRERYTAIHEAMEKTGKKGLRLNVCRWDYPGTWVHDVATSWRMSVDINCSWPSVRGIIDQSLYLSAYCYGGRYNDMDMLEVGRTLSPEEDRTHFGMWCIMSSPLLIGCDMSTLTPEAMYLLCNKELIALNQDSLALQAYVAKYDINDSTYVFVKDIETLEGTTRAIALYNPSETPKFVSIDYADIQLEGVTQVRDLYEHRDLVVTGKKAKRYAKANAEFTGSTLTRMVPAHGCRIYKVTADTRLERSLYEAETAYLSSYQELNNPWALFTGTYQKDNECYGGAKAILIGQRAANDLQWRNVISHEGGDYEMTIRCKAKKDVKTQISWGYEWTDGQHFFVSTNEGVGEPVFANTQGEWGEVNCKVHLDKGTNVIRLYHDRDALPEIDCMTLKKL
ncbi:MAG: alpha-galactosidase [Bacteroidales bacterium]|nr:alpha-galactosidase [Bacteroidales bacterium]